MILNKNKIDKLGNRTVTVTLVDGVIIKGSIQSTGWIEGSSTYDSITLKKKDNSLDGPYYADGIINID